MATKPVVYESGVAPFVSTTRYPYKLEFKHKSKTFGGWFVYLSQYQTTFANSTRPYANGTPYPSTIGPYPVSGAVEDGSNRLYQLITKLDMVLEFGNIDIIVTALDPATFEELSIEPLELEETIPVPP